MNAIIWKRLYFSAMIKKNMLGCLGSIHSVFFVSDFYQDRPQKIQNELIPRFVGHLIFTGLYNICHDYVVKWKHFPRYWPFVPPGNSQVTGEFPSQRPVSVWRRALMFSWICAWTNGWVNNWGADDLRRHRAHYGVTVVFHLIVFLLWFWH